MVKLEKLRLNFIFHSVFRPRGRTKILSKTSYTEEICGPSTQHINVAWRRTDCALPTHSFIKILFIYKK